MRKTFLFILFALACASCADMPGGSNGGGVPNHSLTLAWDSSVTESVAGYKIYIGRSSGDYFRSINVGDVLIYTVRNLESGTYYISCTAYDSLNYESAFSNEIRITL